MALDLAAIEAQECSDYAPLFSGYWFEHQRGFDHRIYTSKKRWLVWKMSRQAGKSFITAKTCASYILSGLPVVLLAPVRQTTTDVLAHHIGRFIEQYRKNKLDKTGERQFRKSRFYIKDNVNSKELSNGGRMLTVTADPSALSDGRTAALTVIDEGQDIEAETMQLRIEPFTDVYRQKAVHEGKWHLGKTIILGRGGLRTSYIEQQCQNRAAEVVHITADDIVAQFPRFAVSVEDARAGSPEHIFLANYYGKPLPSDSTHIFEDVVVEDKAMRHRPQIGLDWGRKDATAGCALFALPNGDWYIEDIFAVAGCSYYDASKRLAAWIDTFEWHPADIRSELNAVGDASTEILEKELDCSLVDHGIFLDANEKHERLVEIITRSERGRIIVKNERIRSLLLPLTYKYNDRTRLIQADHSDVLSALIMAVPSLTGKVLELRRSA